MENKIEKMIDMVEEFYRQIRDTEYLYKGKEMTSERKILRFDLFEEEHQEYRFAKNRIEKLDAICDMLYIRLGTLLESMKSKEDLKNLINYHLDKKLNMIFDYTKKNNFSDILFKAFEEVHRSNMSKIDKDGKVKRREDGKIIKGPDYFPPNLKQFLEVRK